METGWKSTRLYFTWKRRRLKLCDLLSPRQGPGIHSESEVLWFRRAASGDAKMYQVATPQLYGFEVFVCTYLYNSLFLNQLQSCISERPDVNVNGRAV